MNNTTICPQHTDSAVTHSIQWLEESFGLLHLQLHIQEIAKHGALFGTHGSGWGQAGVEQCILLLQLLATLLELLVLLLKLLVAQVQGIRVELL